MGIVSLWQIFERKMNAKYARNCDVDVSSWQIFEKRMNPKYVTSTCVVVIVLSTSNDHYQPFNDCNDDFSGGEYYETPLRSVLPPF